MKTSSLLAAFLAISTLFSTSANAIRFNGSDLTDDYRVGSEWGKVAVTEEAILDPEKKLSKEYIKAAKATAHIVLSDGAATGFYIGKFAGAHLIATNHHVCPKAGDCVGEKVHFDLLHKTYPVVKFLITHQGIDFSLIEIKVPASDEAELKEVALKFAFDKRIRHGQKLLTLGYGFAGNVKEELMGNQDSDCMVFSATGDYRFLLDPDDLNPESYSAWSFAHGCDVSHGDSGSAMIDRNSGEIVGILWTGRTPKASRVQNSSYLKQILSTPVEDDIWHELSYAVPAQKIGEFLLAASERADMDYLSRTIFKSIVNSGK